MRDEITKEDLQKIYYQTMLTAHKEACSDWDKSLLTLSSGALSLSIIFIKDIIHTDKSPLFPGILLTAWICLTLCIVCVIFSFISGRIRTNKQIDVFLEHVGIKTNGDGNKDDKKKNVCLTEILNWASGFSFIIGLVFLFIFSFTNLWR